MSNYQFLRYSVEQGVATITLNRPDVYNALNDEITYELQDALKAVAKDAQVRVVVLTGEGKAFCSGQDLKAASGDQKRSFMQSLHKRYNPIVSAMRNLPKPIVCRLNGVAAGAGCSLALACDVIVASEDATLIEVFINIGLVPDSGSSYFLPRTVGMNKAFELCSMGNRVKAAEAVSIGLINKAVPAAELDQAVKFYTDYFAKAPTKSIGLIKKMLNKSVTSTLEEMLEYEAYCQEIAGTSNDYKEGVTAFLEKRKPDFKGQ
ncbi:MAG TPA: enoyl-CoA hydratase-related protein [Cyclobacteriaceae bacterium]|nr:enoyl-CoA hydratase/isomerase family protein [Cyclobacteriaceae bacterium]HMV10021.1 enoyl-CoA hydratase-related protein [Cyclobacteriaceae bacterium]HMV90560.1 enoyl-CoA hydratase-related protein [Cyclobacteriaceae bacterium]HMW99792.1 enoyl-CoA hydratase-related protein [Cyclobacteriaceae bacterium]HMX50184.1 enoyl-CoA hydratase-related protein [Cyclobacteriaceae bacterium]